MPIPVQKPFTWTGQNITLDDPFDLRLAVNAIVKAIEMKAGWGALIVLMGEMHRCSAHVALRQLVMDELRERSIDFAYGTETEHNFIEANAKDFSLDVPDAFKNKLQDQDGDGTYFRQALINWHIPQAPVSIKNLMKFCETKKISVRPTDAFRDEANFLIPADPIWKRFPKMTKDHLFESYNFKPKSVIGYLDPLGIAMRNYAITIRAIDHIKDSGTQIYIQDCGLAHLYGQRGHRGYPSGHSLSAAFKRAGFNVLSIFTEHTHTNIDYIPRDAFIDPSDLYISNMNADEFVNVRKQGYLEKAHLAKIFRQSGNKLQIVNEWPTPESTNQALNAWVSQLQAA